MQTFTATPGEGRLEDEHNKYSGDWIDEPAYVAALRRLRWDILTFPDERYDSIDPTGCAESCDDLV